jgi:hypothetical protein
MERILDKTLDEMDKRFDRPPCKECGSRGLTSNDISNIIKFLKDNGFDVHRGSEQVVIKVLVANRPALPEDDDEDSRPN